MRAILQKAVLGGLTLGGVSWVLILLDLSSMFASGGGIWGLGWIVAIVLALGLGWQFWIIVLLFPISALREEH